MRKGQFLLLLFVFVFLFGCSEPSSLDFNGIQTQIIQHDNAQQRVIIPPDKEGVPAEVRTAIDGVILDFEQYIGTHISAFSSIDEIPADDLVRIGLLTKAGIEERRAYLQFTPIRMYSVPYDILPQWLEPIFGKQEYLTLRNSSFYEPIADSFEMDENELNYSNRYPTLVCEDFQISEDTLLIKASRYSKEQGIRTNGLFEGTRGYELLKTDEGYRLVRMVEFVKITDEQKETSQPLVIDPM